MIVSDAGKPFAIDERPTESGAILVEAIDILWSRYEACSSSALN